MDPVARVLEGGMELDKAVYGRILSSHIGVAIVAGRY
jgi:hypothetical protein